MRKTETTEIIQTSDIHDLKFTEPIERWDEAIPLGNGSLGCLIWGNGHPLRLSLDRSDLWDKRPVPVWDDPDANFEGMICLVKEKNAEKINEMYTNPFFEPTPTKIPAGRIEINYGRPCDSMQSHLSLATATAHIQLAFESEKSEITTFIHADCSFGYLSIVGELPEINLVPHNFSNVSIDENNESIIPGNSQTLLGYPQPEIGEDKGFSWIRQKTAESLEFAVIMLARKRTPNRVDIVYTVASSDDGETWFDSTKLMLSMLMSRGFKRCQYDHTDWWMDFWDKSSLSLPDKEFERQWYLANYLLGSCSRKGAVPMNLQGVWTADEEILPPWKGEYAHDMNLQMSYWHALKANHLEEHESLTDFLWALVPKARQFASKFLDAPGICFPSSMTIDAEPVGGWAMYALTMTSPAWICQAFDHHWLYTGDMEFLKERAYPFTKETVECLLRWLTPGEDGKLYLPISSSPEIHDDSIESWLTPNSNYDLSIMRYLFDRLRVMADIIGNGESDRWQMILEQLPELSIDADTGLMLSPDEILHESHRHHSHTLPIYPFNQIDYTRSESERDIIDKTITDLEALGTRHWNGYSFPWFSCLYARKGDGENAAKQLEIFWNSFCSPNSFHLNGDYKDTGVSECCRVFTLEGNMGALAALQEMLLQSHNGVIRLFPAIPAAWRSSEVSFQHFRADGGILVSAALENSQLKYVELESEHGSIATILNDFHASELIIETDGNSTTAKCIHGDTFNLELKPGLVYLITSAD